MRFARRRSQSHGRLERLRRTCNSETGERSHAIRREGTDKPRLQGSLGQQCANTAQNGDVGTVLSHCVWPDSRKIPKVGTTTRLDWLTLSDRYAPPDPETVPVESNRDMYGYGCDHVIVRRESRPGRGPRRRCFWQRVKLSPHDVTRQPQALSVVSTMPPSAYQQLQCFCKLE